MIPGVSGTVENNRKIAFDTLGSLGYLHEKTSVLVCGADGTRLFGHESDTPRRSASLIKLFIADYYLTASGESLEAQMAVSKKDRIGNSIITELRIERISLYDALAAMLACSDNTATNLLIARCGFDALNAHIRGGIGADGTVIMRKMLDFAAAERGCDNMTTARDCFRCLSRLDAHPVGRSLLTMQKDRERLMRYILADVGFAGKSGDIEGVYNDAGMLDDITGKRVFAAVLTDGAERSMAKRLCGRVGLAAYGASPDAAVCAVRGGKVS